MNLNTNQEQDFTVTCGECNTAKGEGNRGTHWICEDCRAGGEEKGVE